MVLSFIFFLLIFVVIGVLSTFKSKSKTDDYLLASRNVKPWLVALSAVASCNSGYMFIGMIGYTYLYGISSIWLMFGWVVGDFIASLFIHKKLRIISEKKKALSFAAVISKWGNFDYSSLRIFLGIITIIFLGTYSAAQLSAGSKALHVLFGWNYNLGAIIGAIMVLLYCFAGGIRASIFTDAAQSFVMFFAMLLLVIISFNSVGGFSQFYVTLTNISPEYTNLFPQNLGSTSFFSPILFVIGWLVAGFGIVGQPHVMVRFMAMDNANNMAKVRGYYYSFYSIFFVLTILVGLASRILLPEVNNFDPELALPTLAKNLLPEILVGLILAGLFAATMSTADSQILSCVASITNDFSKKQASYIQTKLATVFVTFTALAISLWGSKNVFNLVLISWSVLGAVFGSLFLTFILGGKPSQKLTIIMCLSAISTILIWRYFALNIYIYEIAPAILVPLLIFYFFKIIFRK